MVPKTLVVLFLSACLPLCGCRKEAPRANVPPPRVVTFSPALTNLAFQMGLGEHVVGVTTRCTLPSGQERKRVGDRLTVSAEAILEVQPDILMIQQNASDFAALAKISPAIKIEHFDIERLSDIPAAMKRVGGLCGDAAAGERAASEFQAKLDAVASRVKDKPRPKVLFVMVMGAEQPGTGGRDSFIHDMIVAAGGEDAGARFSRWVNLDMETMMSLSPEVLVCWTNPGEEAAVRKRWESLRSMPAVAGGRVYVVSDPNWTIPSVTTARLTADLAEMIHPSAASAPGVRP